MNLNDNKTSIYSKKQQNSLNESISKNLIKSEQQNSLQNDKLIDPESNIHHQQSHLNIDNSVYKYDPSNSQFFKLKHDESLNNSKFSHDKIASPDINSYPIQLPKFTKKVKLLQNSENDGPPLFFTSSPRVNGLLVDFHNKIEHSENSKEMPAKIPETQMQLDLKITEQLLQDANTLEFNSVKTNIRYINDSPTNLSSSHRLQKRHYHGRTKQSSLSNYKDININLKSSFSCIRNDDNKSYFSIKTDLVPTINSLKVDNIIQHVKKKNFTVNLKLIMY